MRKILVIALCCLTVAFASCRKESANERFIGIYNGTVSISITLNPILGGETQAMETEGRITIEAGENENEVFAYLSSVETDSIPLMADERIKGVCEGNNIYFETFSISQSIEDEGGSFEFDVDTDVEGVLNNNVLAMNGTLKITLTQAGVSLEMATGTISGAMVKE